MNKVLGMFGNVMNLMDITQARPQLRVSILEQAEQAEQAKHAKQANTTAKLAEKTKQAEKAKHARQAEQAKEAKQTKQAKQATKSKPTKPAKQDAAKGPQKAAHVHPRMDLAPVKNKRPRTTDPRASIG